MFLVRQNIQIVYEAAFNQKEIRKCSLSQNPHLVPPIRVLVGAHDQNLTSVFCHRPQSF